ncbi:MAG: sugar ABC transporter substrate-binding protein [Anaerolineae bacterium]|nr:sugar ABC transporter substrate-binding protein [Anaerolineae bacterium]
MPKKNNPQAISRRQFIKYTAGAAGALALSRYATPTAAQTKNFDWMKYKGTTLRLFTPNYENIEKVVKPLFPEFEKLTGITINYDNAGEVTQARQKVVVELAAGGSDIDLMIISPPTEGRVYERNKFYAPLDPFINDPNLTNPDYDIKDFYPGGLEIGRINGKDTACIPTYLETLFLAYRKDLFEKAGLKPPETLDDLTAAAEKLHSPSKNAAETIHGIVTRAKDQEAITAMAPYIHSMGATWLDKNGDPAINTPEFIKAFQFYADLCRKYGPEGVVTLGLLVIRSLFLQGNAAMWTEVNAHLARALDPNDSKVVDKVGFKVFPAGSVGSVPPLNTLGLTIAANSRNKEAGWYFIQWATSKQLMLATQIGGYASPRNSTWSEPDYLQGPGAKFPDFFKAFQDSLKVGRDVLLPQVVPVQETRDIMGRAFVAVVQGGDAKALLDKAAVEMKAAIDKAK